ncbi:MAG: nucleoside triphosphate pyrophosphohydrolase [Chloroflexi bacterium]|nr:nucleoside triphosphate pyrophosphohydrolase [Chloroflexota bacterium]
MNKPTKRQLKTFSGLRRVVATLRGPEGCKWDRVQTHASLRPYLVEETAEVLAALDAENPIALAEELGDLLIEVLLHVQIAEENGDFTMEDVIYGIGDKLVRRHPHVFGDAVAETPEAVMTQWDELKRAERVGESALFGIPETLPALAYAQAIQRRAAKAGFAFDSKDQAWEALEEEIDELKLAKTAEEQRDELGDVLFATANVARWYDADAEDALWLTARRFSRNFRRLEGIVDDRGVDLSETAVAEKMALWEEAKAQTG